MWDAIHDPSAWPHWWACVERVIEVETGARDGVGALHRYTWKGRLPYRVRFDMRVTRVEPLMSLEGEASGDVEGSGCWHFSSQNDVTIVRYEWRVRGSWAWSIVKRRGEAGLAPDHPRTAIMSSSRIFHVLILIRFSLIPPALTITRQAPRNHAAPRRCARHCAQKPREVRGGHRPAQSVCIPLRDIAAHIAQHPVADLNDEARAHRERASSRNGIDS
ncbi:hypothetical protein [Caballeronia sp. INML3B]|uniref:hypothetical protein n=1 Tax=Caballeronia sp. INML3B TaxID=2921749 RepID=UPI0039063C36